MLLALLVLSGGIAVGASAAAEPSAPPLEAPALETRPSRPPPLRRHVLLGHLVRQEGGTVVLLDRFGWERVIDLTEAVLLRAGRQGWHGEALEPSMRLAILGRLDEEGRFRARLIVLRGAGESPPTPFKGQWPRQRPPEQGDR